jgi:hypothetical protein
MYDIKIQHVNIWNINIKYKMPFQNICPANNFYFGSVGTPGSGIRYLFHE